MSWPRLKDGTTKSCGCYSKDIRRSKKGAHNIKPNDKRRRYHQYEIQNDGVIVYGDGYQFFIDVEDLQLIIDHYWTLTHGYLEANIKGHRVRLHRIVMNAPNGVLVDHKDHDKLNNRKSNLRLCNKSLNGQNSQIKSNNTSGVAGVVWSKAAGKWSAQIKYMYQNNYLGVFSDFESAVRARLNAEAEYFGEFAPQKHLFKQYGIEVETLTN